MKSTTLRLVDEHPRHHTSSKQRQKRAAHKKPNSAFSNRQVCQQSHFRGEPSDTRVLLYIFGSPQKQQQIKANTLSNRVLLLYILNNKTMIGGNQNQFLSSHTPHLIMDDLANSDHSREEAAQKKTSTSAAYEMVPLEPGFVPTSLDVICARGKEAFNHPG